MAENIDDLLPGMRRLGMGKRQPTFTDMTYGAGYSESSGDVYSFPEQSMPARNAYQIIHDTLRFDGDPTLNCATFLTTWMEPEADKLIMENLGKNRVDIDEYEATERIHRRCLAHLHDLWNGQKGADPVGTVVVGSSEGIMLGGLAMKWRWRQRREAAGKDASKPNIVFGANAQVALEKTARYFDIEARLVPVSEESHYCLDINKAIEMIDENTIGMFVIFGSTYTGHYEEAAEMSKLLDKLQQEKGLDVPIHIDGASGAFIAPFAQPDLEWDFRVPRVVSISTSGHKFGLAYPGIGWVLWKSQEYQPKDLTFELSYLGGVEKTFTLNFSHPACFLIAQYYQFIRFGREGYARIMNACLYHARLLSVALEATGVYACYSDIHRPRGQYGFREETRLSASKLFEEISNTRASGADPSANQKFNAGAPVVAFRFTDWFIKKHPSANQDTISTLLRVRGWIIPNYALPPDSSEIRVLRVVVKETTSEDLINRLIRDIMWATQTMLETEIKSLGETLAKPLAPNQSVSNLANEVALSNKATMNDDEKHAHWNNILERAGELKKKAESQAHYIKNVIEDGKPMYQKTC
ncbi:glutamate decarboxylase gad1 [Coemansia spiralis]|uniref:Glutamate decarboxylase n=2 Tax=Coemansia TaxID=4863 RepID=A0A9W8KZX3_9FUNG|nr:glutamate decarboxylase [Coemansia spiralis]KAJ1993790.1 glutamate decarboxylase gad1 [Coemansia umbellata]KAJ2623166.1 glutamate decarboxylase gad1 [Coemansia sp. RSA 1358]KAJ2680044.1 glutamate decarboxylase gad1 [Coemansia spiralis]